MGLFSKIFKIKAGEINKELKHADKHDEGWDFYLSNVDNIIGSFFLDLGLVKVAPINGYGSLILVSVTMKNPNENGLSSNTETDVLDQIEDRLVNFVNTRHQAIYTGRLTSNGKRDFYFYVVNSLLYDKTISEAMVAFPSYEYNFSINEDEKWSHYFDFQYPLPQQLQSIQNRRVLYQLEKNGDKLIKERHVDHWIYFKTLTDKDAFLKQIANDGFKIVDDTRDPELGSTPYCLHLSRIDKVDRDSIDDYTLYLWRLAEECNGEYDGWETSVEKE